MLRLPVGVVAAETRHAASLQEGLVFMETQHAASLQVRWAMVPACRDGACPVSRLAFPIVETRHAASLRLGLVVREAGCGAEDFYL